MLRHSFSLFQYASNRALKMYIFPRDIDDTISNGEARTTLYIIAISNRNRISKQFTISKIEYPDSWSSRLVQLFMKHIPLMNRSRILLNLNFIVFFHSVCLQNVPMSSLELTRQAGRRIRAQPVHLRAVILSLITVQKNTTARPVTFRPGRQSLFEYLLAPLFSYLLNL